MKKKLYPIELITIAYMVATALYILVFREKVKDGMTGELMLIRACFAALIGGLFLWNRYCDSAALKMLRQILPLGFIIHFYPETYYFNTCIFPHYLDNTFIAVDQWLFGCQPSTLFSEAVPFAWFNELMNFAYFSYFFTILGIVIHLLCRSVHNACRAAFIMLFSFFIYYALFIALPVAGPQFHVFEHDSALPVLGPMRRILLFFHSMGEQPTGAVPSSHIGAMCIYMILLWRHGRRSLFWAIAPLSFLLALSTVYIRAHYAIDVLLGFATAPFIYLLAGKCWKKLTSGASQLKIES